MDYTNATHIIPDAAGAGIWPTEDDYSQWNADPGLSGGDYGGDRNSSQSRAGSEQPPPDKKSRGWRAVGRRRGEHEQVAGDQEDVLQDQALLRVPGRNMPVCHKLQLCSWDGGAAQAAAQLAGDRGGARRGDEAEGGAPDPDRDLVQRGARGQRVRQGVQGAALQEVLHRGMSLRRRVHLLARRAVQGAGERGHRPFAVGWRGGSYNSAAAANGPTLKPSYWKTRICNKWEMTGYCPFGSKCHFAHGAAGMQHVSISYKFITAGAIG